MKEPQEAAHAVTVSDLVMDRQGRPRWAITAVFVDVDGSEPRCIDYRVRVVPEQATASAALRAAHVVIRELEQDTERGRPREYLAAELSAPPEGIPRRVFEKASQARLLAKARAQIKRRPERVSAAARRLLQGQERTVGRPPVRSLSEKLALLAAVERGYAEGVPLEQVARQHAVSRSALRDLVSWARHDARPQLFTGTTTGKRGGELTPAARALIEQED